MRLAETTNSENIERFGDEEHSLVMVIYTGGVIGMSNSDLDSIEGAYSPEPNFLVPELRKLPIFHDPSYAVHFSDDEKEQPLVMPRQKDGKRIVYCVFEYEPLLDSSNMTYDDYARLATDIQDNYSRFDAFVVLHGTDTMAFTASALSFMLENLGKPVILTGSQIPIFEARSDGRDNFLGALIMAGNHNIPEVTIHFDNVLLRGNRSTKANAESFDAFKSPNLEPLAKMEINIIINWEAVYRRPGLHKFQVHTNMCPNVGVLRLFPSITEATVRAFLQPPMQGVVLQTYGAGNGPAARQDLMNVLKEASDRGTIIVNCTQCSRGAVSALYSVGKELEQTGVIPGSDMTVEAALMKLSYVLGKDDLPLKTKRKLMGVNLRGEMTSAIKREESYLHFSLIDKLAETMRLSSSEEMHILREAVYPYLLCAAAREGNVDSLTKLRDAGAHFFMGDYDGRTPLHIASSEGHLPAMRYLLSHGAPVHTRDRYGHCALDDAVRFNHHDAIKLLKEAGAHLMLPPAKQGMMLCCAVATNDENALESWHLAGVDFNQGDYDGRTALHLVGDCAAVAEQDELKVKYLMSKGARPDVVDSFGNSPISQAEKLEAEEITRMLSEAKLSDEVFTVSSSPEKIPE
ncbi:hypothetical protein CAPTEDRAFT_186427 [Capitella teleta]|uniref:asparaginase n=1 Tax=Capitella teleta TaxID=283909 RepID=R7U2D4_CAPTE|nr:hypothetical protein CAPTEDRAFT_186427 [Capitella teleta]|eukprot:ELU00500.1 hypothetical protein CAPTEDRAFT_186427 [Capitella teleta]